MRIHDSRRSLVALAVLCVAACSATRPPAPPDTTRPATVTALRPSPTREQVRGWLEAGDYKALDATFSTIQSEYRVGVRTDEQLYKAFRAFYDADETLEPAFDGWVKRYPRSYVALLARGIHHRKVGQKSRGGDSAAATSDTQFQGMEEEYALAMRDLTASERLDPRPLLTFANEIDILANYDRPADSKTALAHSESIDPHNTVVRRLYLSYLAPRWGGSEEAMSDFVDQARADGLSDLQMRRLQAEVLEDRAQTALASGFTETGIREMLEARAMGGDVCAQCLGSLLIMNQRFADAIPVLTDGIEEDSGNRQLLYWRGISYVGVGNKGDAFPDLLKAARLGEPDAKNRVGMLYFWGVPGVLERDQTLGLKWVRECADEGDETCAYNLKVMLSELPPAGS